MKALFEALPEEERVIILGLKHVPKPLPKAKNTTKPVPAPAVVDLTDSVKSTPQPTSRPADNVENDAPQPNTTEVCSSTHRPLRPPCSYITRRCRRSLQRRKVPVVQRNLLTLIKPPRELLRYVFSLAYLITRVYALFLLLGERTAREEGGEGRAREERTSRPSEVPVDHGQFLWQAKACCRL